MTSRKNKKKRLPYFATREEAAQFWDTHSSVDYLDDLEEVELEVDPRIKSPRDLSPRCPLDDEIMLSRFIDLRLAEGRVRLLKLEELYCPRGHYARLAPEAEQLVREVETALKRVERRVEKLAA
jgi:hypothetical protein